MTKFLHHTICSGCSQRRVRSANWILGIVAAIGALTCLALHLGNRQVAGAKEPSYSQAYIYATPTSEQQK